MMHLCVLWVEEDHCHRESEQVWSATGVSLEDWFTNMFLWKEVRVGPQAHRLSSHLPKVR